ncbi:ATP-binding protein [Pseudomonas kribbensis]|uniref:ATP-binding protein n=1 Tax=Pseudomonas kribbensis TaxID=1628086 RepID=UPI003BF7E64B
MVFFLAGVHGVGKTSICSALADTLKIPSMSASQLIKLQSELEAWTSDKKTKEIPSNQQKLLSAIRACKKNNAVFLLDGHFALLDHSGSITPIEHNVFFEMGLSAVILIEDEPCAISQRLENRDKVQWDKALIANLQEAEREGALSFCRKAGIPLLIAEQSDFDSIHDFVNENMAKYRDKNLSRD